MSRPARFSSTGHSTERERETVWLTPHREDDSKWPQKNKDGRQELEIRLGNEHISFEV